MTSIFAANMSYSRLMMPQVKAILGPLVLTDANDIQDRHEATDLVLLTTGQLRIAARMRRPGYAQYADEFTIRHNPVPGRQTELEKIIAGYGDWFFYGHGSVDGGIARWMVVDLNAFRLALEASPGMGRQVDAGKARFRVYDVKDFPHRILVARN